MAVEDRLEFIKGKVESLSYDALIDLDSRYRGYCFMKSISPSEILTDNVKNLYSLVLENMNEISERLFDSQGGELAYTHLLKLKPIMEGFDLLEGPYKELYSKLDMIKQDGNFFRINQERDSIREIVSRM